MPGFMFLSVPFCSLSLAFDVLNCLMFFVLCLPFMCLLFFCFRCFSFSTGCFGVACSCILHRLNNSCSLVACLWQARALNLLPKAKPFLSIVHDWDIIHKTTYIIFVLISLACGKISCKTMNGGSVKIYFFSCTLFPAASDLTFELAWSLFEQVLHHTPSSLATLFDIRKIEG